MNVFMVTATHKCSFFTVQDKYRTTLINALQTLSTCIHLKGAGLKCKVHVRMLFKPVSDLVMIGDSVFANRAKVQPARYFILVNVRPAVVVFFVLYKNSTFVFVPQHVVVVTLF